jgi:hypothetical protein
MPSWPQLINELNAIEDHGQRDARLLELLYSNLENVGRLRGNRNVIFYASSFLQKPQAHPHSLMLTQEDLHGFMAVMHGMDFELGLTLILHTPGGVTIATETIVDYLRSKFASIEVIVPTYAMSAGTMIALATDLIILGRQSQLGPIDPQLVLNGREQVSAQAVLDQFKQAKDQISTDLRLAHLWAPILQTLGPSRLQEAHYAVAYGQKVVAAWLNSYMFRGVPDGTEKAQAVASHFSDAAVHLNHGRRIGREEVRSVGLNVFDLEDDQDLQEAALTAYHAATIAFERGPVTKAVFAPGGKAWMKAVQEGNPPQAADGQA